MNNNNDNNNNDNFFSYGTVSLDNLSESLTSSIDTRSYKSHKSYRTHSTYCNTYSTIDVNSKEFNYYGKELNRKQIKRKLNLISLLSQYNLSYIMYGICDGYVLYGVPNIDNVITTLLKQSKAESKRKTKLMRGLIKRGIGCDDMNKVTYFKEYIENNTKYETALEEGIKELFLIENTNYINYLYHFYDEEKAEKASLDEYYSKNKDDNEKISIIVNLFESRYKIR